MWLTSETEDDYVVRGIPAFLWGSGAALFGVGAYLIATNLASFLEWARPYEKPSQTFTVGGALLFIPVAGLCLFMFFPLIVTRINRRTEVVEYAKYNLLGVRKRRIPYDHLNGGVHISEEIDTDEGGKIFSAYFDLKNGERLKMCSEPGQFQGRSYDVGMRANEFLRTKHLAQSSDDLISL